MTDSMAETSVTPPRGPIVTNVRSKDLAISARGEVAGGDEEVEDEEIAGMEGIGAVGNGEEEEANEEKVDVDINDEGSEKWILSINTRAYFVKNSSTRLSPHHRYRPLPDERHIRG